MGQIGYKFVRRYALITIASSELVGLALVIIRYQFLLFAQTHLTRQSHQLHYYYKFMRSYRSALKKRSLVLVSKKNEHAREQVSLKFFP